MTRLRCCSEPSRLTVRILLGLEMSMLMRMFGHPLHVLAKQNLQEIGVLSHVLPFSYRMI